ncbi:putative folate-biopterin transporter 3 [Salvia divinorum]|uniref:Folate-biopterin transporter 3 n=1 Tax=Salvia divinorum TaxID=28513 RepID=A0ABD1I928_SALDI
MDDEDGFPLQAQKERGAKIGMFCQILSPFSWLKRLSDELHWSFVLGVVIVYGINQGIGLALSRVGTQYYMKDEQKLQPSEAHVYHAMIMMPWIVKPLWGLLTDIVPIAGRRRRPYFVFAGTVSVISMIILSLKKDMYLGLALLLLICGSAGAAVGDVTIDACVTENSIAHPSLAGEMQSLCGLCSSVGQLIGFISSGFLVHQIGSKGALGVLSIPATLVIVVGIIIQEPVIRNVSYKRVSQKFQDAGRAMWIALRSPVVWRPCLYMYLSLAVSLQIHEGMFYWYTDAPNGPSFSQEAVGSISAVGAVGSLLGMIDLILVLRINLIVGVPDYVVVVFDAAVTHMIGRLKWMPLLVLSSKLCPSGIEGTFFALLMSIDHVGSCTASWCGGLLLHTLNVTRTTFDNLWLAILIRSLCRLLPIGILFLIPSMDPNVAILPADMLISKRGEGLSEPANTEMESLISRTDHSSQHSCK